MMDRRVSVIIPAYRASRTLGRALDSLRDQNRPPDEVVVVDDGSPDGDETAAIVAGFGGEIRLIRQSNGGGGQRPKRGDRCGPGRPDRVPRRR